MYLNFLGTLSDFSIREYVMDNYLTEGKETKSLRSRKLLQPHGEEPFPSSRLMRYCLKGAKGRWPLEDKWNVLEWKLEDKGKIIFIHLEVSIGRLVMGPGMEQMERPHMK